MRDSFKITLQLLASTFLPIQMSKNELRAHHLKVPIIDIILIINCYFLNWGSVLSIPFVCLLDCNLCLQIV